MDRESFVPNNKSCKTYFTMNGTKVYFSGDFDSGNLERVEQVSTYVYKIHPGYDKARMSTRKTFFHFRVHGMRKCTVRFHITRMHLLEHFIRFDGSSEQYHPVFRTATSTYKKLPSDVKLYVQIVLDQYSSQDDPELCFPYSFQEDSWVQFAFTYPYSYEDSELFVSAIEDKFKEHPNIYLHSQTLCRTSQERRIRVLTITQKITCQKTREDPLQGLDSFQGERPFRIDKPKVVLSARVHPGETPSSYSIEGAIRFLLNEKDYRAHLLRKHFHFIVIPMLNPQGVYEGMFRNDLNGDNLNRLYNLCDRRKQYFLVYLSIGIWSVKKYLESLNDVGFFFDFHAHPSRKGFFIYGNAFEQFTQQVQAQIFSKMIECNCPYFENLECIYSEKAMSARDKYDSLTKEGCARVFNHKLFNIVHSYTVECGYFAPNRINPLIPLKDIANSGQYGYENDWEQAKTQEYSPEAYMLMGKCILITILDLFHLNPYSRATLGEFKSINSLRKFTAQRIYNEVERFRLIDSNCYRKIKDIASIIDEYYYQPRFKKYGIGVTENAPLTSHRKTYSLNSRLYLLNRNHEVFRGEIIEQGKESSPEGGEGKEVNQQDVSAPFSPPTCSKLSIDPASPAVPLLALSAVPSPVSIIAPTSPVPSSAPVLYLSDDLKQTAPPFLQRIHQEQDPFKQNDQQDFEDARIVQVHRKFFQKFQKYDRVKEPKQKIFRMIHLESNHKLNSSLKRKYAGSSSTKKLRESINKLQDSSSNFKVKNKGFMSSRQQNPVASIKIQSKVIQQLLNTKYQKDFVSLKRPSEGLFKIDRVATFLRRETQKYKKTPLPQLLSPKDKEKFDKHAEKTKTGEFHLP